MLNSLKDGNGTAIQIIQDACTPRYGSIILNMIAPQTKCGILMKTGCAPFRMERRSCECYTPTFCLEPDAVVEGIDSFTLFLKEEENEEDNHPFTDTPYMPFVRQENGLIRCQFTKKLLDTCVSFPEG